MTDAVIDDCINGTDASNATSVDCVKLQDPYLAVVGVICAIISCIGSTIALLIIKVSTEKERHLKLWHRKRFWFGLFVNVTCEVSLTPIALALAPLAIVSPIASLGIVWTAWFSARGWIIPKEPVSLQDYFGMALCITGVVLSAAFGPSGERVPKLEAMAATMSQAPFAVVSITSWTIILSWVALQKIPALKSYRPRNDAAITAGLSGFGAGGLASYSLVCLKTLMLGIRLLTEGETTIPELPWNFWVCTVFLGPVAVFQVYVLEMTLGAGGANWVIPVYTGMLVIMSAVQSGIVLEEFELLPDWKLALFGAGVAVALVGLGVLGGSQNKRAVAKENLEKSQRGSSTADVECAGVYKTPAQLADELAAADNDAQGLDNVTMVAHSVGERRGVGCERERFMGASEDT